MLPGLVGASRTSLGTLGFGSEPCFPLFPLTEALVERCAGVDDVY